MSEPAGSEDLVGGQKEELFTETMVPPDTIFPLLCGILPLVRRPSLPHLVERRRPRLEQIYECLQGLVSLKKVFVLGASFMFFDLFHLFLLSVVGTL